MNTNTQIVILAAGKGSRMGGGIPKALVKVDRKPMLHYVVDSVEKFTSNKPVTVIGYMADTVEKSLGNRSFYALQTEQKGTGHAVSMAKPHLSGNHADTVIVLYADQPYVSPETMKRLSQKKHEAKAKIVIATAVIDDDDLFENQFYNFGRIIRDEDNIITKIVEKKDANEYESSVREVNPAYFCLDKEWMIENLAKLNNNNSQEEYYLTDLVKMAFDQGLTIESVQINEKEALGANTPEQLEVLESFLKK